MRIGGSVVGKVEVRVRWAEQCAGGVSPVLDIPCTSSSLRFCGSGEVVGLLEWLSQGGTGRVWVVPFGFASGFTA